MYLEAGSGAPEPEGCNVIKRIEESVKIPVIVGGGGLSSAVSEMLFAGGMSGIINLDRVLVRVSPMTEYSIPHFPKISFIFSRFDGSIARNILSCDSLTHISAGLAEIQLTLKYRLSPRDGANIPAINHPNFT